MDTGRDVQDREEKKNDLCSGTAAQGTGRGCIKGKGKTNKLLTEVTS